MRSQTDSNGNSVIVAYLSVSDAEVRQSGTELCIFVGFAQYGAIVQLHLWWNYAFHFT
jgi:hypothetical protein